MSLFCRRSRHLNVNSTMRRANEWLRSLVSRQEPCHRIGLLLHSTPRRCSIRHGCVSRRTPCHSATVLCPAPVRGFTLHTGTKPSRHSGCRRVSAPPLGCLSAHGRNKPCSRLPAGCPGSTRTPRRSFVSSALFTKPRPACAVALQAHSPGGATAFGWASLGYFMSRRVTVVCCLLIQKAQISFRLAKKAAHGKINGAACEAIPDPPLLALEDWGKLRCVRRRAFSSKQPRLRMKPHSRTLGLLFTVAILFANQSPAQSPPAKDAGQGRLIFQTNQPWSPRTNINADTVMVYGLSLIHI